MIDTLRYNHRLGGAASHSHNIITIIFLQLLLQCQFQKSDCLSLSSSPPLPRTQTTTTPTSYFATCIPGLSQCLSEELISLGADNVVIRGNAGVSFTGSSSSSSRPSSSSSSGSSGTTTTTTTEDTNIGLKALLWSRTAHRIMELIATNNNEPQQQQQQQQQYHSEMDTREDLYFFIRDNVDVKSLLGDGKGGMLTLSCKAITSQTSSDLRHSHYTALTVKNALVDACRTLREDHLRPDVDTLDPDVLLQLILHRNNVSLYRVLNGNRSLHKRGYKPEKIHKAALKETLASGLLLSAGWEKLVHSAKYDDDDDDGSTATLLDPMMGSATFLTEAALIAADVAPGLMSFRRYPPPALLWKGADIDGWDALMRDAVRRKQRGMEWLRDNADTVRIAGCDQHESAFGLANMAIRNLDMTSIIHTHLGSCQDWRMPEDVIVPGRTMIVTNPPWGKRLQDDDDDNDNDSVQNSWEALGVFLKNDCVMGCEAWILSGNKHLTKSLRMKKTRSFAIQTAREKLRWIQYHIFDKKKKE